MDDQQIEVEHNLIDKTFLPIEESNPFNIDIGANEQFDNYIYPHDDDDESENNKRKRNVEEKANKSFKRISSSSRKSYNLHNIKQAYDVYDKLKEEGVKDLQKTLSKTLGIPQGTFAGWLKAREENEDKIKTATEAEMNHYQGKGNCHRPFYPKQEEMLRDIINTRRANNEPCSGNFIRETMMTLVAAANEMEGGAKGKSFNASHNWLTRFSARMNVPNRKGPIPGTIKMHRTVDHPSNTDLYHPIDGIRSSAEKFVVATGASSDSSGAEESDNDDIRSIADDTMEILTDRRHFSASTAVTHDATSSVNADAAVPAFMEATATTDDTTLPAHAPTATTAVPVADDPDMVVLPLATSAGRRYPLKKTTTSAANAGAKKSTAI